MPIVVVAAIAAGGAVAAGAVAASAVIYAGIAVSVVGKVTKSKELSQIGSGMSLGAGLASAATSIFGASSAAGGAAGGMTAENAALGGADGLGGTGVNASAGTLGSDATASAIGSGAEAAGGTTAGLESGAEGAIGSSDAGSSGGLLSPSSSQQSVPLSSTPQASVAPGAPTVGGQAVSSGSDFANSAIGSGSIPPPPDTSSSGIAQWWAKQPETTKNRILQMGGQAVGGLFDGWSSEQKLALQREQLNLDKQKYDTSVANANSQPVVRFKSAAPTGGLLAPTMKG